MNKKIPYQKVVEEFVQK